MRYTLKKAIRIFQEEGTIVLVRKFFRYLIKISNQFFCNIIDILYLPSGLFKVKNLNPAYDLGKLIDFVFFDCSKLIKPFQVRSELLALTTKLNKIKPKFILEIGTWRGGTLLLFSKIASNDAVIISVDFKGYPKWRIPLYRLFALPSQQIYLIRADSHSMAAIEKVKTILNGNRIDFLFIDGDHGYEGVKKDFNMYSPLVREGGIIAFHDIAPCRKEFGEVHKFWEEIKLRYENVEIVENWNQGWAGVGLIKNDESKSTFFSCNPDIS